MREEQHAVSFNVRSVPLLLLLCLLLPAKAETLSFDESNPVISMGNSGASHYRINGFNDPVLALRSGVTYTVNRTSGGHPLVFAYNDTTFPSAVTYSGNLEAGTAFRQSSVLRDGDPGWLFRVAPNASAQFTFPSELEGKDVFYYCEVSGHRGMIGKVTVEPLVDQPGLLPTIHSISLSGTTLSLAFTGAPNSRFVVRSTTTLSAGTFSTLETTSPPEVTTDSNGSATVTLQTASRLSLFLRVEQLP